MIVLGERHAFSSIELGRLQKQFNSIDFLSYKDTNVNAVIQEIESHIESNSKSLIVLNTKASVPDKLLRYLTGLGQRGLQFLSTESFLENYLHKCYISRDHTDLHFLEDIKPLNSWQNILKYFIDISGLLILIPITIALGITTHRRIQKESPGVLFYKQDRVGHNNYQFSCIKFRSMSADAEENGIQFAKVDDTRVFPWGETMRKTRIDELPQILNVLKGDMHIIGPRPERKHWTDKFEKQIPYYDKRHLVKPGITGWAQVMYPYGSNTEDARQKLMYDLYYIKHWSILLEIKVIWKTFQVVFGKKGI